VAYLRFRLIAGKEEGIMDKNEYKKKYPNYCRDCKGWGMFKRMSPDIFIWDCKCIENGHCPRCGELNTLNKMDECSKCGWHRDDKERGLPGSIVI